MRVVTSFLLKTVPSSHVSLCASSYSAGKQTDVSGTGPRALLAKRRHAFPRCQAALSRDIDFPIISISFDRPTSLYFEQYVYMYTHLTPYRLYMNYRCYQIV